MVIGLTIVGFGTSAPNSWSPSRPPSQDQPAIAIGNVLGSNIANILLILGVSAVIAPLLIPGPQIWRDLGFMLAATAAIWLMLLDGQVTRGEGAILVAWPDLVFLATAFLTGKVEEEEVDPRRYPAMEGLGHDLRRPCHPCDRRKASGGQRHRTRPRLRHLRGGDRPDHRGHRHLVAGTRNLRHRRHPQTDGNRGGQRRRLQHLQHLRHLGHHSPDHADPADPRFAAIDMPWVAATAVGLTVLAFVLGGLPRIAGALLLAAYAAMSDLIQQR
jgi:cation:H+ antiporter